jgi:HD-GYP domain-containing protein (c-di-GMP phosphodiesterase class II)
MNHDDPLALSKVITLLRDISRHDDPTSMLKAYAAQRSEVIHIDRTVSLSRRDLEAPFYRITRSDLWKHEINPWYEKEKLPLLSGGLLGDLLYAGEPRIIDSLDVPENDPAAEYFHSMGSLIAIPHFDAGQAVNMVVHMNPGPHGFDHQQFPEMVLLSGMFGRAMKGLVIADELRSARKALQEQYLAVGDLSDMVLKQAGVLKTYADSLEDRVRQRTDELEAAHLDAIYMLATASEEKDDDTANHLRRMQGMTAVVSRAMGLPESRVRSLAQASILHDVGKLHVPDDILKKPGPLTHEERAIMQEHTLAGQRILPDRPYFALARSVARSHHENWDGTGYPDRLSGEQIPFEARLVHLVDVYDALSNARPYKSAWPSEKVLCFLREQRAMMFDPQITDVFLRIVEHPA